MFNRIAFSTVVQTHSHTEHFTAANRQYTLTTVERELYGCVEWNAKVHDTNMNVVLHMDYCNVEGDWVITTLTNQIHAVRIANPVIAAKRIIERELVGA